MTGDTHPPRRPDDTLHEVTEVAVISHRDRGVLLLHSAERRWHLPDATVHAGEAWDEALRNRVRETTGIDDLSIGSVVLIQNYAAGEVHERPQFGVFFSCATHRPEALGDRPHRWVRDRAAAEELELFHPLIADLVATATGDEAS
jgi:ADP-ribose pyrophosphatase YjhB (NUDIX family)